MPPFSFMLKLITAAESPVMAEVELKIIHLFWVLAAGGGEGKTLLAGVAAVPKLERWWPPCDLMEYCLN